MPSLATAYVSIALSRLRRGVSTCCWIAALSLLAQLLIFGVAAFMDVRYETLASVETENTIVSAAELARDKPLASTSVLPLESAADAHTPRADPVNPNRVTTKNNQLLAKASAFAMSAGGIAMLLALPMIVVGVLLGAGSATPGVEKIVSSFMWALVVSLLVLPVGSRLGLPWDEGGLVTYAAMTQQVDKHMIQGSWGSMTFYACYVLLPLACVIGVAIVGVRFNNGVVAGIMPKESMRLDPALEREAANMKATSLMGGRNAVALRAVTPVNAPVATPSLTAVGAAGAGEIKPGILHMMPGESPKRLI